MPKSAKEKGSSKKQMGASLIAKNMKEREEINARSAEKAAAVAAQGAGISGLKSDKLATEVSCSKGEMDRIDKLWEAYSKGLRCQR